MSFVVSHPTGNTFVKALLEELEQKNLLAYFSTTLGFGEIGKIFTLLRRDGSTKYPTLKLRILVSRAFEVISKGGGKREDLSTKFMKTDQKTSKTIAVRLKLFMHMKMVRIKHFEVQKI